MCAGGLSPCCGTYVLGHAEMAVGLGRRRQSIYSTEGNAFTLDGAPRTLHLLGQTIPQPTAGPRHSITHCKCAPGRYPFSRPLSPQNPNRSERQSSTTTMTSLFASRMAANGTRGPVSFAPHVGHRGKSRRARKQTLQLTTLKVVVVPEPAKAQLGTRRRTFRGGNTLKKRFATHSMPRHGEI